MNQTCCCLCNYKQKELYKEGFFITTNKKVKNIWICLECKIKKNIDIYAFRCYFCDYKY